MEVVDLRELALKKVGINGNIIGKFLYISIISGHSISSSKPVLVFIETGKSAFLNKSSRKLKSISGYARMPEPRFFDTTVPDGQPRFIFISS